MQQAEGALNGGPAGTERYIYNALDTVLYHVMTETAGFRATASHSVFIFTADCFSGPDPTAIAQAIRDKQTDMYLFTLGSSFGFWKETVDIVGDAKHLYEVPHNPEIVLPHFLPKVAWRASCQSDSGSATTPASPITEAETSPASRVTTERALKTTEHALKTTRGPH